MALSPDTTENIKRSVSDEIELYEAVQPIDPLHDGIINFCYYDQNPFHFYCYI